ncbi:MAG: YIP1 family protein, partial [Marinovum sp.]|nr:YIP1 family protein [Marinovum sp.]
MNSGFTKLAVETVTEPQSVIGWLQSLQLSREVLWCAMGLIIVLNALLFGLTNI